MASNLFSRILSPNASPSVYETLRQQDDGFDDHDIEERAGLISPSLSPEGTRAPRGDVREDFGPAQSVFRDASPGALGFAVTGGPEEGNLSWLQGTAGEAEDEEGIEVGDDVPASLLVEDDRFDDTSPTRLRRPRSRRRQPPEAMPASGGPNNEVRARWNTTQEQQGLHQDPTIRPAYTGRPQGVNPLLMIDGKERALWMWTNVQNVDGFIRDVYNYYIGKGIYSIVLSRALNLLTVAFILGFGLFLTACIDYGKIPSSQKMSQVIIPKCTAQLSTFWYMLIALATFIWFAKLFQWVVDVRRLWQMHNFFLYLLEIPDIDIQTVSWQQVVQGLMNLRDANPETATKTNERLRGFIGTQSKQRMDAHDIANRLMRRDNYLISLINKDILDIAVPVPFWGNRYIFSKILEWNLSFCILDFVFDERGHLRPLFLHDTHRRELSNSLRSRFFWAGIFNIIIAPFLIVYSVLMYFFRYFNEYQKNPSAISSRQYTPYAEWKFREFNELWHLYEKRLNMSYPFASRYISLFPKDKVAQVARFVGLLAGALASILALASIIDPELFFGFEITHDRTVLFYLGVFTAIWAAARSAELEENLVFDPEYSLNCVIQYTHYCPEHWRDQLHSDDIRKEFASLYKMKLLIFLEEIIGIMVTPFILIFALPRCSDRIIDFFREFTVHVDGLGHVCSFAVFDFKTGGGGGNAAQQRRQPGEQGAQPDPRDAYYATKDNKMMTSYYNFVDQYAAHPRQAKTFSPPPAFAGLVSPQARAPVQPGEMPAPHRPGERPRIGTSRLGASMFGAPSQKTPRFAPAAAQASPMASMLLDPHHQPLSPTGLAAHKPSSRATKQSQLRRSRHVMTDVMEDEEEAEQSAPASQAARAGAGSDENSPLGGSWKTTRAGNVDGSDDDGGDDDGEHDGGVLGMVYQFSKAQTRGGVQI